MHAARGDPAANANPGADTIAFDFPGSGPVIIQPVTQLPDITDRVTINGYSADNTQPNTNATGTLNTQLRIVLDGTLPSGFVDGLTFAAGAEKSVVKGLVISNFSSSGIDAAADGAKIEGNFVGTTVDGLLTAGNNVGINVRANDVVVGGLLPAQRNLISGNFNGIEFNGLGKKNGVAQGNVIGAKKDLSGGLANRRGIELGTDAKANTIGGSEAAAANIIAFNQDAGIRTNNGSGNGNRILRNSIALNDGPGIDLKGDGVTANDPKDPDTGPNRLQNFPELTTATLTGGTMTIIGTLNSTPKNTFTIQFFATPPGQGTDEGKLFLGQAKVTTNKKGNATIDVTFTPAGPVTAGDLITATATSKEKKDTSEFSAAIFVT